MSKLKLHHVPGSLTQAQFDKMFPQMLPDLLTPALEQRCMRVMEKMRAKFGDPKQNVDIVMHMMVLNGAPVDGLTQAQAQVELEKVLRECESFIGVR